MYDITITGDLGSGKSSIAKNLCQLLNFEYYSTGKIQREIGIKKGMNTLELNYFSEDNDEVDKFIDNRLMEFNESETQHVFDSRMAWFFIKKSFKVYLTVNPFVAAKRVMEDAVRKNEPVLDTIDEKANNLIERRTVEDRRFKLKYGVDCGNLKNYDLVVDTSKTSIEEIAQTLYKLYQDWLKNNPFENFWASPFWLFPTKYLRNLETAEVKSAIEFVEESDYSKDSVVTVLKQDLFFYILDGHKRVSRSIFNKVALIPVSVIEETNQESAISNKIFEPVFNINCVSEWEKVHQFIFDFYPKEKVEL